MSSLYDHYMLPGPYSGTVTTSMVGPLPFTLIIVGLQWSVVGLSIVVSLRGSTRLCGSLWFSCVFYEPARALKIFCKIFERDPLLKIANRGPISNPTPVILLKLALADRPERQLRKRLDWLSVLNLSLPSYSFQAYRDLSMNPSLSSYSH